VGFFVDANVIIYSAVEGPYRASCLEVLAAIAERQSDGRTSTAVVEEIWHVELTGRAGDLAGLAREAFELFTPLLPVTDETVELALSLDGGDLGANDRVHLATCRQNGLDAIVTADAGFDGIRGFRRVDPLDARALRRLLAAG
jgi:predicted nucleic acid-binding protein